MKKALLHILLLSTLIPVVNWSCSAERNNPIAKAYHNTTSHYNAYYIAREKLSEAEFMIEQNRVDNYNEILQVYHPMDEDMSSSLTGLSEDAIKKASLPIQYHKNSKWVDDCYILIGRARYYKRDFPNAIQTFKYVNSKSEDDLAKQEALSWLLRSFIESGEYNNARAVSDYLKKQALDKKTVKEVTMARADFFQSQGNLEEMLENLEIAVQFTKPKRYRARVHFIIAQIYQELGDDSKAYEHYKLCLKSNPNYDLSFYAKLYLAQVSRFNSDTDIKEIKKYFEKLLKDKKNEDYKDKIYYELAKFQYKQQNLDKTIDYLRKSIAAGGQNPNQKAYSYLMMAEIHYEDLQEYEISKAYYDSTLQTLSQEHRDYENIKRRHAVLEDFTKQLAIIQFEDSVQKLATMDSTELIAYLDEIIKEEEEKERLAREREEIQGSNELRFGEDQGAFGTNSSDGGQWYFYNLSAVSIGQTEFQRVWGKRTLEDNWRRRNKGASFDNEEEDANAELEKEAEAIAGINKEDFESEEEYKRAVKRTKMLAKIPFDEESLTASHKRLEDAFYNLGKIYNLNLLEYKNASDTFEELLKRYPESEYKLEVMYFLYLLNVELDTEKSDKYKTILLTDYPNSLYAKLILNPDYLKDAQLEDQQANALYQMAYANYESGNYDMATQNLDKLINDYAGSTFIDKAILLRIIIEGKKKDDVIAYKEKLSLFIEEYNTSELLPFAQKLLKGANDFIEAATSPEEAISEATGSVEEETSYVYKENDSHFFMFLVSTDGIKANEVLIEISDFNNANFSVEKLKTAQLLLDENTALFTVKDFKNKKEAMRYYEAFQGRGKLLDKYKTQNPEYFIIGSENFPEFYKSKDISEYRNFFQQNYF